MLAASISHLRSWATAPYTAEIYQDAEDANQEPTHVSILKKKVNRSTHLKAQLASGGGCAVRLIPSQQ